MQLGARLRQAVIDTNTTERSELDLVQEETDQLTIRVNDIENRIKSLEVKQRTLAVARLEGTDFDAAQKAVSAYHDERRALRDEYVDLHQDLASARRLLAESHDRLAHLKRRDLGARILAEQDYYLHDLNDKDKLAEFIKRYVY